ncbi:MAG: dihydrodipicolinate reductase [Desulfobacterales bacterium]|nr:MAG: dihydrodipicolinate reductase [Desulfobacterales bacterium]UCD89733.1 MAG: dihydrodipicolinate reductase [Desulfobacterales bacterium]
MNRMKIMVNGLPGNMASNVVKHALGDNRFSLIPCSLTGPEISDTETIIDSVSFSLIQPDARDRLIDDIKQKEGAFLSVDFSLPPAVNSNAEFYCNHALPFVMGTTGGDRQRLEDTIRSSSIAAVIAPNMAKQIVGFQAMMEFASNSFPDLFDGYSLAIKESHQKGKADTSGTAKAMVRYFKRLGLSFAEEDIVKERDPEIQQSVWKIPEEYLQGHGYHTYGLVSKDQTVQFEFTHNVNGRDVYAQGTLDALIFLAEKITKGAQGQVFSMIDVLKGV